MSWSVVAKGIKEAVAANVAQQFANVNCVGPEQTLKNQAGTLIAALLAAQPDGSAVEVTANGSGSSVAVYGDPENPNKVTAWQQGQQTLQLSVQPLWGFLS